MIAPNFDGLLSFMIALIYLMVIFYFVIIVAAYVLSILIIFLKYKHWQAYLPTLYLSLGCFFQAFKFRNSPEPIITKPQDLFVFFSESAFWIFNIF